MTAQASESTTILVSGTNALKRIMKTGVIVAAISATGFGAWYTYFRPFVSTDDARIGAALIRVASDGGSGRIIGINAKESDHVTKGQILLELDHSAAQALLTKAKANATRAERELKRARLLHAQNGVTEREVETAETNHQIASSDLVLAQLNYEHTFVKSPIDGIVIQKNVELGNILEQRQTAFTVADVQHAYVTANVQETAIAEVKIGQPVDIKIDEGGELSGKVSEIRSATASQFALIQSENPSGNFTKLVQRIPIRVAIDTPADRPLRVGQSVNLKIRVRE